ncbi:MAG: alpha/beta hydrolase [Gemmatimonadales bacterium]|nr:alpha/beta hydrolase [Gemmatimonadales bacterium]
MDRWFRMAACGAACLAVGSGALVAQVRLEPRPVPSFKVASFTFQSPSMGVRFAVNVGIPKSYQPGSDRRYPLLVSTDGDWLFPITHETANNLVSENAIEEVFVVSIGTSYEDGQDVWVARRIYEFSAPGWERKDAWGQVISGACQTYKSPPGRCTGGAPGLLKAIADELIPMIAAQYPIDRDRLGLFGVSAGGVFAAWAMFQAESPFHSYLISSPAMAYGDLEVLRQEARWAAAHKDLPIGVYFDAGALEMEHPVYEGMGRIMSGMMQLVGSLSTRNYPNLRMTTEVHPGLSHADVVGTVVARGLRVLYPKRDP